MVLLSSCPADHVPDWQPRILLGMVEARSVDEKNTDTQTPLSRLIRGFRISIVDPHPPLPWEDQCEWQRMIIKIE